jgi:serine/threonine-protein kinase
MEQAPFPHDIAPGQVLAGRYEVLGLRRRVGLSVAYEVRDQQSGAIRELQYFPPLLFDGQQEAREFAASWEPWKRIRHGAVLSVHEISMLGTQALLLVTDLPPGRSLRDILADVKRLGPAEVRRLGLELLDGLTAIHSHGLVHGDVKPLTVFGEIDPAGAVQRAQLVDGGSTPGLWSAKDLGDRTALIGTPYYAPVEQFGGEAPTVQSDLYNLATLLFEALTGVQPWKGRNFLEVFQSKLQPEPPRMSERAPGCNPPAALEQAIRGGLFAATKRRYASAQAFKAALEAVRL